MIEVQLSGGKKIGVQLIVRQLVQLRQLEESGEFLERFAEVVPEVLEDGEPVDVLELSTDVFFELLGKLPTAIVEHMEQKKSE